MIFRALLIAISSLIAFFGLAASYHLSSQRAEFPSAFLLNFSTIFLEFVIIALIVERALKFVESRKWAFAQRMISRSISTSYLDVARIIYSLKTSGDIEARKAFAEFVSVAENNLSALRSLLEGYSPHLEQDVQEKARLLERDLRHLYRVFKDKDISTTAGFAIEDKHSFDRLMEICIDAYKFSMEYNKNETLSALREVEKSGKVVFMADASRDSSIPFDAFFESRWGMQNDVVKIYKKENTIKGYSFKTIRYDISGALALRYLVLDYNILIAYQSRNYGTRVI